MPNPKIILLGSNKKVLSDNEMTLFLDVIDRVNHSEILDHDREIIFKGCLIKLIQYHEQLRFAKTKYETNKGEIK